MTLLISDMVSGSSGWVGFGFGFGFEGLGFKKTELRGVHLGTVHLVRLRGPGLMYQRKRNVKRMMMEKRRYEEAFSMAASNSLSLRGTKPDYYVDIMHASSKFNKFIYF